MGIQITIAIPMNTNRIGNY